MLTSFLFKLYGIKRRMVRHHVLNAVRSIEGGEFVSPTLRKIFKHYHLVGIGLYTHGGCFDANAMAKHTTVGRYCSIAHGVRTFNRNHPLTFRSTHAFFFNPKLGYCTQDTVSHIPLTIEHDVWIGANALIYPNVQKVGTGAVIAAGAVVNKDVPPYAVVVGNPGRVVRFRFSPGKIEELLVSRWWEQSIEEIRPGIAEFLKSLDSVPEGEPV